jgi:hypothetical protein
MTGAESIRFGRRRRVEVRFVAQRGKGSHGTLYYGSGKTIVKDSKKERSSGLLADMLANLGLLGRIQEREVMGVDQLVLAWPAILRPQPDGRILARFPDLPEAVTEGDDAADARVQAALEPILAYKAALYSAMCASGMTQAGLARQLGIDEKDVRRLLDPRHRGSRLGRLVEALADSGVDAGGRPDGRRGRARL